MVRATFALLLILCLPVARAADAWPIARGPSREPAAYLYDPATVAKAPRAFLDDAVATILYAGSSYLVEADGTIEAVTHEVTRLNGRKGIDKLGEFRGISFTPSYQKLTLNEARIHKAGGKVVAVEPRHVHLRDVGTDYQVYDQEKQLVISFPGLEVGDVVEVKWTTRGKNPEHDGQFFQRYAFGDPQYPVVLDEFRVRLPREMALKSACVNGKLEPTITEVAGLRLHVWKTHNRERLPRDENLPSKEELRPTVLVSTFMNWEQVGRWKQKLRAACWNCTEEVRKIVRQTTMGLATPAEKARALTYWVRRNIRYVSAGDRHDYTPHQPQAVIANRFGDCKDTSQLLAVMLREAGLRVELATLGAQDDGQVHPDVPSPWGTHAILLVTIGEKEHWIDTTASLAAWDVLPRDDLGRLCYLTDDKGKLRLKRTPMAAPEQNRIEQTTDVWVGQEGTSRCRRAVTAHALSAISARDRYLEVPPGERRRQVTAELQDANSRTRLVNLAVDEKTLGDFDRPVTARMDFEIPRHFTGSAEREGSVTDSPVWTRLLTYHVDADRAVPMVLPTPFESVHTYRFHAPAALGFESVPKDKLVKSKWGTFKVTARAVDDDDAVRHVEVVFHTRVEKTRVEIEELEDYRAFHEEVNREYRVWLTLRAVSDVASAPRLEQTLLLAPQNVFAARTLAAIYTKANRLADASRVLARSCFYTPDDAELWELRVQTANSPEEEERLGRELVNRYPKRVKPSLDLAALLITQGKQPEARTLLGPLTKAKRAATRANAHYQLARSHYRKDELKLALTELNAAAKEDATAVDTVRAHVLRGQVLDELKRPAEAIAAYKNALELSRNNQEVLLSLVRLCLVTKDELTALGYLRRYVLAAGNDVSGLLLAAETYLRLKRFDEALEMALRARELNFHESGQRILGLIYLARGDHAKAHHHLGRAEPDTVVLAGLIQSAIALGKAHELRRLLDQATKLGRTSPELTRWTEAARTVLRRYAELRKNVLFPAGKEDAGDKALAALVCAEESARDPAARKTAETLLATALESGIALGPCHALAARLLLGQGKLRQARKEADRAIALSPGEASGYHVRGRIRLESRDRRASEDLARAADLSGQKDADILAALAEAQASEGKRDTALTTIRSALKLRPADRDLEALLRGLEQKASPGK